MTEIDVTLKSPFTALVVGPTGSGKTRMLMELIRDSSTVATPPPVEIIYCYGAWQEQFVPVGNLSFREGLIPLEDLPTDGRNRWIILDDLMDELAGDASLSSLFTKHSHHKNLSVFFVTQNLFHPKLRTVSINSHYMFLFKNPRDASSIGTLGKQLFPGNAKFLVEAYRDATKKPYSYLFVDLKQNTDERVRLRTGVTPRNGTLTTYGQPRARK